MKKINFKNLFENKTKVTLIKKFIIGVFLIFSFSLLSFFAMVFSLRNTINNRNDTIINTTVNSLNNVYKKIDNIYKSLELYSGNDNLFTDVTVNQFAIESVVEINKSINENPFVREIVFLKKGSEYVVTSQGIDSKDNFFEKKYYSETYNKTFFDNIITDYLNVKILAPTTYKNVFSYPAEDPESMFAVIKSYEETGIKIIMFIPEIEFIKETNINYLTDDIRIQIYDYNDSIVYSNNEDEMYINTNNVSKDFRSTEISRLFNRYNIIKSSYNYFYFVVKTVNYEATAFVYSIIILLAGLLYSLYKFLKNVDAVSYDFIEIYKETEIDENDSYLNNVIGKIRDYKEKIRENNDKIKIMSEEIKNSIFIKLINSSSFYSRHKKTVDVVFSDITVMEKIFMLSIETVKNNSKLPRYGHDTIINFLVKMKYPYVHIEEKNNKDLFVIGFDGSINDIIDNLNNIIGDIRENDIDILVCLSNEFDNLTNIYNAYKDIKICRDYRGINDRLSILSINNIKNKSSYLPVNFKEELSGRIIDKNRSLVKEYITEIFEINIENNVPLCKFEFLLRQMLNTVIEILSNSKKEIIDVYELEQMFLTVIEGLRDNFDVNGIINSFANMLHMGITIDDTKKSTLNRTDILKYINSHYMEDLYLTKIATEFNTTPKYFSNYFKREFLVGFNEYLTQLRISHAKELLIKTDISLAEISEKVGYLNQATFAIAFKKTMKVPPGKYRELNK